MDLDKLERRLTKIQDKVIFINKKIWGGLFNILKASIGYGIVLYIYIWVYNNYGWDYTIISLLVGVIVLTLREIFNR